MDQQVSEAFARMAAAIRAGDDAVAEREFRRLVRDAARNDGARTAPSRR